MSSADDSIRIVIETGQEIAEENVLGDQGDKSGVGTCCELLTGYVAGEELDKRMALLLYQAALEGDWESAQRIIKGKPEILSYAITGQGDTLLHVAAAAGHISFVHQLVQVMNASLLEKQNIYGNTALSLAAVSGAVEIARLMCKCNDGLALIRSSDGMTPLYVAASLGHREMVLFLIEMTPIEQLKIEEQLKILVATIHSEMYDVSLKILRGNPLLATFRLENEKTALHVLARKTFVHERQSMISSFLWFTISIFAPVSGLLIEFLKMFGGPSQGQAYHQLVQDIWEKVVRLPDWKISELITEPSVLHEAAEVGNVVFLVHVIRSYPDLIWKVDQNLGSIFHHAVLCRQEGVFSLIYDIGAYKDLLLAYEDKQGNNILHMAATLPPTDRLNIISGAALQMQRELLWFKEVKKLVWLSYRNKKNSEGYTPVELFKKQHKPLAEEGEKWMKDLATSSILVATLISIVTFAAAFAIPGGNIDDSGMLYFSGKLSSRVFLASDVVALVFSTTSVAMFLSILTSRYGKMDFLVTLPLRLILGLMSLFLAIAGMLVAFLSTVILFHENEASWVLYFVGALLAVSTFIVLWLLEKLVFDTFHSVCQSVRPRFVFNQGKISLFNRKDGSRSRE